MKLWFGKSRRLKQRLADTIAKNVMAVLQYGEETVSVGFEEAASKDRAEQVDTPDIQAKWDQIYKKPRYAPF